MIVDPPMPERPEDVPQDAWPVIMRTRELKKGEKPYFFHHETALVALLNDQVLHANDADSPKTVCLYVNCNDVFAWGCADSEAVTYDQIEDLWKHWRHDQSWGPAIWCMKSANLMPQEPLEKMIRDAGIWDLDGMGLRENRPKEAS